MRMARVLVLFLLACLFAAVAAVASACDSSGTLVATDGGADAHTFDVVSFDGPTPFEAAPPHHDGGDAGPTSDAAAFGTIEFRQPQVGGGQFVAAFYATPL